MLQSRERHFNLSNNKTNNLILNLTPENVTQHSRIVTTTRKGSMTNVNMTNVKSVQSTLSHLQSPPE